MKNVLKSHQLVFFMALAMLFSCAEKKTGNEEVVTENVAEETMDTRASPLRTVEGRIGNKSIKIQYGSPAIKDRVLWGDLVPYNEVWRTGANEATHLDFSEDLLVEGQRLPAGKYSLFTIPKENGPWTVIFNSEWDLEHGHYQYKEENDVLRVTAQPAWENQSQERLAVEIVENGIVIKWEKLKLPIRIE